MKTKITRELPVMLSDTQIALKADELARAVNERTRLERDLKDYAAGERKKIKDQKAKAKELAEQIESEQETAEVDCEEEHIFQQNKVVVRRLDTREIVEERPMSAEERQETLPLGVNGKGGRKLKIAAKPKDDEHEPAH